MIPTHAHGHDNLIADNYLRSSTFRSSTEDGLCVNMSQLNQKV